MIRSILAVGMFAFLVTGFHSTASAQDVLNGVYEKVTHKQKEIIPYDPMREADIFWSKRIWRVIDVNEKMNLPFKYPKEPLIQIIHTAAMNGELTVYDPKPEWAYDFIRQYPVEDVRTIGYSRDTMFTIDPITLEEVETVVENELTWDKIKKYKLKEDWFFDENTSTLQVRIISLAPIMDAYDSQGNLLGDETMYWIYYPDLRPILAKYEVFNAKNDAIRLSWEDVFEARLFSSYITMESNVHDRTISDYDTGLDALLESERIKNEIFLFEHDLWTY